MCCHELRSSLPHSFLSQVKEILADPSKFAVAAAPAAGAAPAAAAAPKKEEKKEESEEEVGEKWR
jgi:large subunit ribosomal protein LP0